MTALLEYLDLTALLEYIDLLSRYSGGPPGPLSGWGSGQNAPVAPPCGRPCLHQWEPQGGKGSVPYTELWPRPGDTLIMQQTVVQ